MSYVDVAEKVIILLSEAGIDSPTRVSPFEKGVDIEWNQYRIEITIEDDVLLITSKAADVQSVSDINIEEYDLSTIEDKPSFILSKCQYLF